MRRHRRRNAGSRDRSKRVVYSTEQRSLSPEEVKPKPFDPALARLQRDWAFALNACEWMDKIEAQELDAQEEIARNLRRGPLQRPIPAGARVFHSIVERNAADVEAEAAFRKLWRW